jgi:hypothetical protein
MVRTERRSGELDGRPGQPPRPAFARSAAPLRRLSAVASHVQRRLQLHGLASHLVGLLIRWRFERAGILVVHGGLPFPSIENRGGRIEVGNCGLFSGVRLECA